MILVAASIGKIRQLGVWYVSFPEFVTAPSLSDYLVWYVLSFVDLPSELPVDHSALHSGPLAIGPIECYQVDAV